MHQTHSNRLENHLPVFIQVVHSSEVPYHKKGACILESWSKCKNHSSYLWHIKQTWFNPYWKQAKKPAQWKINKAKWKSIAYVSKPKVKPERATFSLSQWVVETHMWHGALPGSVIKLTCDYGSSFQQPTRWLQFIWASPFSSTPHSPPQVSSLITSFFYLYSLYVIFFFKPKELEVSLLCLLLTNRNTMNCDSSQIGENWDLEWPGNQKA